MARDYPKPCASCARKGYHHCAASDPEVRGEPELLAKALDDGCERVAPCLDCDAATAVFPGFPNLCGTCEEKRAEARIAAEIKEGCGCPECCHEIRHRVNAEVYG